MLLDFAASDDLAGFRLQRLELFNWGTFHNRVWAMDLNGENGLLTGDIGSGKSTIVDAVTTLLVPPQRIAYNKAAGAESRERSLRSYVLGYYKTERSESGRVSKPVALRDHNSYSVILAVFTNSGYGQTITLAQVFWNKDLQGQPARFYLIAEQPLSIKDDFANFGTDINQLKKRLRATPKIEIYDNFPPYSGTFRRRFGIENDQALDLFHQTVSMKSVGNLTTFVRSHMLEASNTRPRIEALLEHFDNLTQAHAAVIKAKRQIDLLTPLTDDCQKHRQISDCTEHWRTCRDGLQLYFADQKAKLLRLRLEKIGKEGTRLSQKIKSHEEQRQDLSGQRDELKANIAANGGDRLSRIKSELQQLNRHKAKRQERAERYQQLARQVDLSAEITAGNFLDNQPRIESLQESLNQRQADLQNNHTENSVRLEGLKEKHRELRREIESLLKRRSNINSNQIKIRAELCAAVEVSEKSMPFAGELLKVNEEDAAWEGAAERLLHNFGLSLLVPDELYGLVSAWVDKTHLRGRLVYFRVRPVKQAVELQLQDNSLIKKLTIKPDSEFYPWLEQELGRRFDYVCTDNMAQFQRQRQAISQAGQIKSGGKRHEKDDRHRLDDRSRYILGWTNETKIAALRQDATTKERAMQLLADEIADIEHNLQKIAEQRSALDRLGEFRHFDDLDWQNIAKQIAALEQEQRELAETSNILQTLNGQLTALENEIKQNDDELDKLRVLHGKNEEKERQAASVLSHCQETIDAIPPAAAEKLFAELRPLRAEAIGNKRLTVESCDSDERRLREWLQKKIDNEERRLKHLGEKIIRAMQDFCREFPLETREIDADLRADEEFMELLANLKSDDLPRFAKRFKELLNENTIREIANFQSHLNKERQNIKDRIEIINRSLADIEYNPGRFIVLEAQANIDQEITAFRQQLRACTEGALTGSETEQYAENKFLQVKEIIDRFRGREGTSDADKRWRDKVTDVRRWFEFAASERWQEDGSEYEHYTDSSGKSGGQKEKLAYTVLAAGLAYQFGLEWGAIRSRSFRFVVIDEAFGRGSDESARYGLELFKKLCLQLLIVTPLQKIHIIEPYVNSVGFVHNEGGRESFLRNLTIEEYRQEREARSS